MDASRSEEWHRGSLSIWHSDIGIPNNIQKLSGIVNIWSSELHVALELSKGCESPFRDEVEKYGFLYGLYRGLRHPFILWYERWACIKPLQGNLAFFRIRASRGPFRLKHKTQGPSHIHILEGKLLLRCLWKDGLPLLSKTGNHLSSPDEKGCPGFSSCCFTEIDVPIDLRWVSERISGLL